MGPLRRWGRTARAACLRFGGSAGLYNVSRETIDPYGALHRFGLGVLVGGCVPPSPSQATRLGGLSVRTAVRWGRRGDDFVVQRLRSLVKRAPLVFMVLVLLSSLAAYSFVVGFNPGSSSYLAEFDRLDAAWFSVLLALLLLLVLSSLVFLVKPSSFLNGEWFAGCSGLSFKKMLLLVLLGAVVPCVFGLLALASPLSVDSDALTCPVFVGPNSPESTPAFGASSAASSFSAGFGTLSVGSQGFSTQVLPALALYAVATCAFTALFEEMLFRGVVIPCVIVKTNQPALVVLASSLLFAAAHMELALPIEQPSAAVFAQTSTWIAFGQFALKPIQAALFGFCMGSLYCSTRSLKLPVAVHFVFDMLYFAPSLLSTGAFPSTYTSGNLFDLVLLSVSVFFLAVAALRLPRGKTRQEEAGRGASSGHFLFNRPTRQTAQESEVLASETKRNGLDEQA